MGARRRQHIPCDDCGRDIFKVPRVDRAMLCIDCGTRRAMLAAQEMASKRGPAWERWQASKGPAGRPRRSDTEG